jgi:hypothetical protein
MSSSVHWAVWIHANFYRVIYQFLREMMRAVTHSTNMENCSTMGLNWRHGRIFNGILFGRGENTRELERGQFSFIQ